MIRAQALVKRYKDATALDGIDLEIRRGEVFGLLGPNGAGKTTFVKLALGLLRPTSGSITLFDLPPTDPSSRRTVGFAPESPAFPPFLSAREVMALHARLTGRGEDQIDSLLLDAELEEAPRRVRAFSKGMVRRLALAQAFIGDPDLLVLDEPTADLDPLGRRDVRNQLVAARARGAGVLLNSHLLSEVERVCDRVAIVHRGRLLAIGTLQELVPEGKDLETVFVELIERERA